MGAGGEGVGCGGGAVVLTAGAVAVGRVRRTGAGVSGVMGAIGVRVDGSGKRLADAVAADSQAVSNSGLGHAGTAEQLDAAGLTHRQQINHGDQ